jgi:hypothetical protein
MPVVPPPVPLIPPIPPAAVALAVPTPTVVMPVVALPVAVEPPTLPANPPTLVPLDPVDDDPPPPLPPVASGALNRPPQPSKANPRTASRCAFLSVFMIPFRKEFSA